MPVFKSNPFAHLLLIASSLVVSERRATADVLVEGLEITQAIQEYPDSGNPVPLVEGKPTYLRAYLRTTDGSPVTTSGRMKVTGDDGSVEFLEPINGPVRALPGGSERLAWERVDFEASFELEDGLPVPPTVFSQTQSREGMSFVRTRHRELSSAGFLLAMEEEERNAEDPNERGHAEEDHVNEKIDYLALEGGGVLHGFDFVDGVHPDDMIELTEVKDFTEFASGTVTSDGDEAAAAAGPLRVGDEADDAGRHALIEFDLGDLPQDLGSDQVTSAELALNIEGVVGSPYDELGDLRILQVNYGVTLDPEDHRTRELEFLRGSTVIPADSSGAVEVDISAAVKDAVEKSRSELQLMIYFASAGGGNDGAEDLVEISTSAGSLDSPPSLRIDYEQPRLEKKVIAEADQITGLDGSSEVTRDFTHNFEDPVVIAQPLTRNGGMTAIARIIEVQGDHFTVVVQEPDAADGNHLAEKVDYLVVESGSWQTREGVRIEAGNFQSDLTASEEDRHADGTLNFVLFGEDSEGRKTFEPQLSGPMVTQGNYPSKVADFQEVTPFEIAFFDVRYTHGDENVLPDDGAMVDLAGHGSFASDVLPTGSIPYHQEGTIRISKDLSDGLDPVNNKLALVRALRSRPEPRTLYYGIVYQNAPSPESGLFLNGMMSGKEGLSETFAHELGHALGRSHTISGGRPEDQDKMYPIYRDPVGQPLRGGSIGEVGFSSGEDGTGRVWDPKRYSDFMSYTEEWVSPYTYRALLHIHTNPSSTPAGTSSLFPDVEDSGSESGQIVVMGSEPRLRFPSCLPELIRSV